MHYVYLVIGILTEIYRWLSKKVSGRSLPAGLRYRLLYGGTVHEGSAAEYRLRHLVWRRHYADHDYRHGII